MYLKPMEKADPTPEQMSTIRRGAEMSNMLPYISSEIEGMMKSVQNKVFVAIANGTLTPEMAVSTWHEMAAYRNLLKRYETHVRVGTSLADKHITSLTLGE
jgi:hypothetical protein